MKTKDTPRYKIHQLIEEDINRLLEAVKVKPTHNTTPFSRQYIIRGLKENINLQNYITEVKSTTINKIWKDYNEAGIIPTDPRQSMLGKTTETLKYLISYRQHIETYKNENTPKTNHKIRRKTKEKGKKINHS